MRNCQADWETAQISSWNCGFIRALHHSTLRKQATHVLNFGKMLAHIGSSCCDLFSNRASACWPVHCPMTSSLKKLGATSRLNQGALALHSRFGEHQWNYGTKEHRIAASAAQKIEPSSTAALRFFSWQKSSRQSKS